MRGGRRASVWRSTVTPWPRRAIERDVPQATCVQAADRRFPSVWYFSLATDGTVGGSALPPPWGMAAEVSGP